MDAMPIARLRWADNHGGAEKVNYEEARVFCVGRD